MEEERWSSQGDSKQFMNLCPFQETISSKKDTVFESIHTEVLFRMKYSNTGNAKAIPVSIFLRNILTFVSKYIFFFNLKIDCSEQEEKM